MKLSLLYFGFNLVFFYLLESLVFSEILSPKVFPGYQLVSPLKNTSFGLSGQLRVISPPYSNKIQSFSYISNLNSLKVISMIQIFRLYKLISTLKQDID